MTDFVSTGYLYRRWGVSRPTALRMLSDGTVTGINIGTPRRAVWRILRSSIEKAEETRASGTTKYLQRRRSQ